ncbi:MAG: hypothetical protein U1D25_13105 [Hydrogenophaga sp.]|uniref:hypothetical protein n=1 Tax=Hydrogenophaga sp. TaxID=1904254 RepID=UPI0027739D4A|nr:hypothetical protein [Hydrogenophaga sp.]MDP2416288.1 hypothetical protein [Hydrogenophaga sp.]MDZ4189029.1 hypothetical protein [Hydrogenophaga sp.]
MAFNTSQPAPRGPTDASHTAHYSAVTWAVLALSATMASGAATGTPLQDTFQMAPQGYSGAINTPSADVLPLGSTVLGLTNSVPEVARKFPGVGGFGTGNVGFGLLPGLELVGRLSFDGNLQCNLYSGKSVCPGGMRDLSVSGKYQLPLLLPYNTRLAVGFTDFGGAATNFRQAYGVGTSTLGPMDVSLGFSKGSSRTPLMDGVFGNLTLRVSDQLAVVLESDTQAKRLGAHYVQPLTRDMDLQLGYSHKLSGPAHQQSNQFTAALRFQMDKKLRLASQQQQPTWAASPAEATPATLDQRALALSSRLAENGFANIHIAALPAANGQPLLWWVQADPVGWRKDHQQALGAGLVQWMLGTEADDAEVVLSLTYMGQPTTSVHTTRNCLNGFAMGQDSCGKGLALRFFSSKALPQRLQAAKKTNKVDTLVSNAAPYAWKPQFELGANIRSAIGTEYGLADYSAALDVGAQVQLGDLSPLGEWGKGWMWQGNVLVPVARSEDFDKGGVYSRLGHPKTEVDQSLVSYMRTIDTPWASNVAVQASVGAINRYSRGGQVDAVWMNTLGDWRVGGTLGAYSRSSAAGTRSTETPALLSVRRSVLAGSWQLEGTVGQFLAGDTGFKAASHHWFGDYKLSFYINESKGSTAAMPKRRFAGFQVSLPLGPKGSTATGWGNVRGQDRMAWGVQTKIGETNNALTSGYAEAPQPRHGVWTDITNHDRSGPVDMWANRHAMRAALQQEKP